jgi:hypothetical protein
MACLVARCHVCGIPWPTFTRADKRLMDHDRLCTWPEATRFMGAARMPARLCEGSFRVLPDGEYGENGDDRFAPPAVVWQ